MTVAASRRTQLAARCLAAVLFATLAAAQITVAQAPSGASVDVPAAADAAQREAAERRIREDVAYLASDELEGRGPYSRGQELAVEFVARRFGDSGLAPAFGPSYFQPFAERKRLTIADDAALSVQVDGDGEATTLKPGRDFLPLHAGERTLSDVPIVFAGFGISAPEHGYDDYAGLDVAGKAVLLLRHEPASDDPAIFAGRRNSPHAMLARKVALAKEKGAAVVVFVTDADSLAVRDGARPDSLVSVASASKIDSEDIAVVHVLRDVASRWFPAEGERSLAALEERLHASGRAIPGFETGERLSCEGGLVETALAMKNVVARLDGAGDLKDQILVVGAHVDHVGRGEFSSLAPWTREIHNGADDNASGTAALLEVARRCAAQAKAHPDRPRRTILFAAFAGEEMGLLGSEYFVSRPPANFDQVCAMINFDMVGRYRERLILSGYDTSDEFRRLLRPIAADSELKFEYESGGYGPSDHASFYARGKPVLHFFTGLHSQYHRPSDDIETLNFPGVARIADFASRFVWALVTTPNAVVKTKNDLSFDLAGNAPAGDSSDGESLPTNRPLLGVTLDRQEYRRRPEEPGYPVGEVLAANPSARALLRKGDRILEIDGVAVSDANALPRMIAGRQPGQRLTLSVRRNGEVVAFQITLASR